MIGLIFGIVVVIGAFVLRAIPMDIRLKRIRNTGSTVIGVIRTSGRSSITYLLNMYPTIALSIPPDNFSPTLITSRGIRISSSCLLCGIIIKVFPFQCLANIFLNKILHD